MKAAIIYNRLVANGSAHGAWSPEDSASLYNLKGWGGKYFGVAGDGHLVAQTRRGVEGAIDVKRVVDDVVSRGIKLPVLIRFQDILRHRVEILNESFTKAISQSQYQGKFLGVYPIKVNQLREVVEEIADAGEPYRFGLEAGSKGELMAVLAMNANDSLTIVNGYKDEAMIRLALLGLKLGRRVIVVVEKPQELGMLLRLAREEGVKPLIGLRAKLQTQGTGKWKYSAGHSAKFGLTTPELLAAFEEIRAASALDRVQLLHFHIGSQVTDIQAIKDAVKEAARIYAKLRQKGLPLEFLDCGGGLGVDYDGTHTTSDASTNYTLKEYAASVVQTVQEVCRQEKVPEPDLVTESGRSLTAHHSVVIVNAFGAVAGTCGFPLKETPDEAEGVKAIRKLIRDLDAKTLAPAYHEAAGRLSEAEALFKLGFLSLEDKAKIEALWGEFVEKLGELAPRSKNTPEEVAAAAQSLRDQYLCNFSLFQSLPDSWAIGQVFPIIPIHRLEEQPAKRAALIDITCDSDGKITRFACAKRAGAGLPLHDLVPGEPYYLGIFLVGAYQATMGDIHNLFGRVSEVHVFSDRSVPGGYYFDKIIPGQTVRQVLSDVQYSDVELVGKVRAAVDARVRAGELKPSEGAELMSRYEAIMDEYPYFDPGGPAAKRRSGDVKAAASVAASAKP
jgi:arginine decarboxylase